MRDVARGRADRVIVYIAPAMRRCGASWTGHHQRRIAERQGRAETAVREGHVRRATRRQHGRCRFIGPPPASTVHPTSPHPSRRALYERTGPDQPGIRLQRWLAITFRPRVAAVKGINGHEASAATGGTPARANHRPGIVSSDVAGDRLATRCFTITFRPASTPCAFPARPAFFCIQRPFPARTGSASSVQTLFAFSTSCPRLA